MTWLSFSPVGSFRLFPKSLRLSSIQSKKIKVNWFVCIFIEWKRLKFDLLKEYWERRQDSYWQWTLFLLTTINYNPVQNSFNLPRAGHSQAIKQKIKLKYFHDALESMKFLKNSQGIEFIKWFYFFFKYGVLFAEPGKYWLPGGRRETTLSETNEGQPCGYQK